MKRQGLREWVAWCLDRSDNGLVSAWENRRFPSKVVAFISVHGVSMIYYDPLFLQHETGTHPENAGRLRAVMRHLQNAAPELLAEQKSWSPATAAQLELVHSQDYLARLEAFCAGGGGYLDPDTLVSERSFDAAKLASGALCDAVGQVLNDASRSAFCLVRPPGHHALSNQAMGFCLVNNVAVAARFAVASGGLTRVLIVDWDVHHGNGTQDIFYEDPQVAFFSMHRYPFYPGTGAREETGSGEGRGATRNLPISFGTPRREILARFEQELADFSQRIRPELILISAGFDAHRDDPIGGLGLESEDFTRMTRFVCEVAQEHAGGRIVSTLEGGYDPQALAECVLCHLRALREGTSHLGA